MPNSDNLTLERSIIVVTATRQQAERVQDALESSGLFSSLVFNAGPAKVGGGCWRVACTRIKNHDRTIQDAQMWAHGFYQCLRTHVSN